MIDPEATQWGELLNNQDDKLIEDRKRRKKFL